MEADEETGVSNNLKRQREPLSDSEENAIPPTGSNDSQKRRRLEAAGRENRSPKPSSSGRLAELQTKPDTPMIPSVRSRIQLLSQKAEGGAPSTSQRCFSDPGSVSSSAASAEKGVRQHLLADGEFNQRMERFKVPVFQDSPTNPQTSPSPCQKSRSDFVTVVQQKLQCPITPSSKQASRIRQERELELNQVPFQPISENAWLKRSSSDSSITQQGHRDPDLKDGSFTEGLTPEADKSSLNSAAGEEIQSHSNTPVSSAEQEPLSEKQEPNSDHGEGVSEDKTHERSSASHLATSLLFSTNPTLTETDVSDKPGSSEPTPPGDGKVEEDESSKAAEEDSSDVLVLDGDSSFGDEELEPSTDEELRMWRYPQTSSSYDEKLNFGEKAKLAESPKSDKERDVSEHVDKPADIQMEERCPSENATLSFSEFSGKNLKSEEELLDCTNDPMIKQLGLNPEHCKEELAEDLCQSISAEAADVLETDKSQKETENPANSDCEQKESLASVKDEVQPVEETQTRNETQKAPAEVWGEKCRVDESDADQTDVHMSDLSEMKPDSVCERQKVEEQTQESKESREANDGGKSKKVTFILEPELINSSTLSETDTSIESTADSSLSDAGLSSHDETNTAEMIEQMFDEVLEYAEKVEKDRRDEDAEDRDSGIGPCSESHPRAEEKEKDEEPRAQMEQEDADENLDSNADDLLTFPPSGILSPLSKSVEAVVTPLHQRLAAESDPPSLLFSPDESTSPPPESAPLYSVDAYRTQRQSKLPFVQSVTPAAQRRVAETPKPQPSINTKEKIAALNEEAGKLQTVINQTLQALSCCVDEEHGRGSLEEAEAEKLLLVSSEKRSALLAEVARLREERSSESEQTAKEDAEFISQQPCRGTVHISNIQLPLKVEFVCSSQNRTGRPSHYFFVLIRYGAYNIVATPLATAADAQNGDSISFPTSVTLKDIRSSFEIEVEVYSLSHTSGTSSNSNTDKPTTKSRVTPRKLLNTLTRSSNTLTGSGPMNLNARRSSSFSLVGSHKITLASLGQSKFPLDKMKFEGKIRKLLGDEFQEKVPFLSPLEGSIYLQLKSESHSDICHQGFLTMFELISGFGLWHRRYFVLEGCDMLYWNNPSDRETKESDGRISLSSSPGRCVRPVMRDSCARPFTFELVRSTEQQQQNLNQDGISKCWFSADTKEERLDWMEKLSQALLDFHTWNQVGSEDLQPHASSSDDKRESML